MTGVSPSRLPTVTLVSATTQDRLDVFSSTTAYTPPGRMQIRACVQSRFNSCRTGGWYDWPVGKRIGVIIGILAAVIIILLLLRCFSQSKYSHAPVRKKPMLLSELRAQQAAEEGAAAERCYVERLHGEVGRTSAEGRHEDRIGNGGDLAGDRSTPGRRNGGSRNNEEAPLEDVPPAYHEAVRENRRTRTESTPQANDSPFRGWPPMYADVVQPAPVASPPSRVPYPALPQSPRR
jgi:hypothetical protein